MSAVTLPNIFVAGFGRCGTSAMMQLLWHGGCGTAGNAPDFEDGRLSGSCVDLEWLSKQKGTAVKLLFPIARPLPATLQARTIWMDRNPKDQARSQIKMLEAFSEEGSLKGVTKNTVTKLTRTMQKERPYRIAALRKLGPVLMVRFRDMLADPEGTAQRVQGFLGSDLMPDAAQASQAIIPRPHSCAADMRMEITMINAYRDLGGHQKTEDQP